MAACVAFGPLPYSFSPSFRSDRIHGCRSKKTQLSRIRSMASSSDVPVPDSLSSSWIEARMRKPIGPTIDLSADGAIKCQLNSLKYNDQPHLDHGVEVMYRFAGFDPFERSKYFGPCFDLGQFERFRRLFHHSSYRVLLGHKESKILSSLWVNENRSSKGCGFMVQGRRKKKYSSSLWSRGLAVLGTVIG